MATLPASLDDIPSLEQHFHAVLDATASTYWKVKLNPESLRIKVNWTEDALPVRSTLYIALNLGDEVKGMYDTRAVFPLVNGHVSIAYNMDTGDECWPVMWRTKAKLCSLLTERWVTFGLMPRTHGWQLSDNSELTT